MRARYREVSFTLLAPVVVLAAPAPSFAVDYLTAEQAQAESFPGADRFEVREVELSPEALAAVASRLGAPFPRSRWILRLAWRGGELLGALLVDDVVGKFERITYSVGLGLEGTIRQVEILSYRESHGQEVRLPLWRKQFVGKSAASPLRIGQDIAGISGATLSCAHVAEGIRRITNAFPELLHAGGVTP